MAKFALLQRQFLTKMYKSVGYLQNYPRTDKKKKGEKKKIQYTFEPLQVVLALQQFRPVVSALVVSALRKSGLISNGCSGLIIYLCGKSGLISNLYN